MKISYSEYELHPLGSWSARVGGVVPSGGVFSQSRSLRPKIGAVLRVESDGHLGYADLCPLPEYGDPTLANLLESLTQEKPLPLAARSLQLAEVDRKARALGQSLFSEAKIKNHFLCTDVLEMDLNSLPALLEAGFSEIKIKMGRELRLETEMLRSIFARLKDFQQPSLKLRLDFNSVLKPAEFQALLAGFSQDDLAFIDFIEDPCPYDPQHWNSMRRDFGVSLAADLAVDPFACEEADAAFDVLVLKPARQDAMSLAAKYPDKRLVVTHSMDFAVGQLHALVVAHELAMNSDNLLLSCGLQVIDVFEKTPFQALIQYDGPYVLPPSGIGIGLDATLEAQDWKPL